MSLDLLDAAFVRRLSVPAPQPGRAPAARSSRPSPAHRVAAAPLSAPLKEPAKEPIVPQVAPQPAPVAPPPEPAAPSAGDALVARLLARAPGQWDALAGHVEEARQRGRRVIAVAGGRSGEGRTTLVACLARRLRDRGRDVVCTAPHDLARVAGGPEGRDATHDKRIILVDAGIWFPPGPIRRTSLQIASLGCEAAILVRRSGAAGGLARQAALEGLGIEVLGEVLTFTSPLAADDIHDGGAAA